MLSINYITRPFFNDIALELIKELKRYSNLSIIIIVSPWTYDYLETDIPFDSKNFNSLEFTNKIKEKFISCYKEYFEGAEVLLRCEDFKESSIKNTLSWIKQINQNKGILGADLHIIESLSLSDIYFLYRIRNKKIFYIVHDPIPHSGENRKRIEVIRFFFYKYVDKFLLYSNFSTLLFKSNYKKFKDKTITLKIPIYHNRAKSIRTFTKKSKRQVLFFGRISLYKGVELFYEAADLLSKEFDDVSFIIAGKPREGYSPGFLSNNTNPNIEIINQFINSKTLSELMIHSDYCVLPYRDATQSGVVMTCYSFNLPVLVSNCPGLLEYCFDHNDFSFKNGDLEDLIFKMRNLLLNRNLLSKYKESIYDYYAQNVSQNNVDQILKNLS